MAAPQSDLVAQYASSHTHLVNRACHTVGIPLIVVSIAWWIAAALRHSNWHYALYLFLAGWALQFIGHAFERKLPEFFHDPRFLFIGLHWWIAKLRGRA